MATRAVTSAQVDRMKELRAEGLAAPAVGARLGIPESTVRNWWNADRCVSCDEYVSHSDAVSAICCESCNKLGRKIWTADAIVDAMHRFAAANGRPPSADDWRHGDSANNYPSATAVYSTPYAAFPTWADALEAAGFARPRQGQRFGERWWTAELVLAEIRATADNGVVVARAHDPSLHEAASRFYGSWPAAVHAAGLITRSESRAARREAVFPHKERAQSVA